MNTANHVTMAMGHKLRVDWLMMSVSVEAGELSVERARSWRRGFLSRSDESGLDGLQASAAGVHAHHQRGAGAAQFGGRQFHQHGGLGQLPAGTSMSSCPPMRVSCPGGSRVAIPPARRGSTC